MGSPVKPVTMPQHVHSYDELKTQFSRIRQNDFLDRRNLRYFEKILARLGNPHKNMGSIVHVTGTNGKGSVTWKVARCLEREGHKVGLYVSPHIRRYTERITIQGKEIEEEEMVNFANHIFSRLDRNEDHIGMVGVMVCIAFLYFQSKEVQFSVIEAGIGAMLDHTNVVDPIVSVITSIGNDHLNIIGPELEDVALNKSHIFKKGRFAVVGSQVMEDPVIAKVIYDAKEFRGVSDFEVVRKIEKDNFELDNQLTAKAVLRAIFKKEYEPPQDCLKSSPPARHQTVVLRGRFQNISFRRIFGHQMVTFDVGHNSDALKRFCQRIFKPSVLIFALAKRKSLEECSKAVVQCTHIKRIFLLDIHDNELRDPDEVKKELKKRKHEVSYLRGDLTENLKKIGEWVYENRLGVYVSGSFHTVDVISAALGLDLPNIANTQYDSPVKTPVSGRVTPMKGIDSGAVSRALHFQTLPTDEPELTPFQGGSDPELPHMSQMELTE